MRLAGHAGDLPAPFPMLPVPAGGGV